MTRTTAQWAFAAMMLVSPALADAAELWGNILSSTAWDNPRDNYGVYSFQTDAETFEFLQLNHKT